MVNSLIGIKNVFLFKDLVSSNSKIRFLFIYTRDLNKMFYLTIFISKTYARLKAYILHRCKEKTQFPSQITNLSTFAKTLWFALYRKLHFELVLGWNECNNVYRKLHFELVLGWNECNNVYRMLHFELVLGWNECNNVYRMLHFELVLGWNECNNVHCFCYIVIDFLLLLFFLLLL